MSESNETDAVVMLRKNVLDLLKTAYPNENIDVLIIKNTGIVNAFTFSIPKRTFIWNTKKRLVTIVITSSQIIKTGKFEERAIQVIVHDHALAHKKQEAILVECCKQFKKIVPSLRDHISHNSGL